MTYTSLFGFESIQRKVVLVGVGLTVACLCAHGTNVTTIGFGSCIDDNSPNHRTWKAVDRREPDVFLFMGDNVYIDAWTLRDESTIDVFKSDYERLQKSKGFQKLVQSDTKIFATWDDHDYGPNDAGAEFSLKALSQKQFLNFWYSVPTDIPMSPGVYQAHVMGFEDKFIQFILLDIRYFKSPWKRDSTWKHCRVGQIVPTDDEATTMLGETQWTWLETRLKQDVDLHIIVSSIQVIPIDHCSERWGGMPHERDRLIHLLSQASAKVVLLSGDRHLAEVSRLPASEYAGLQDDLYEVTSSAMTSGFGYGKNERNQYRLTETNVRVNNFGWLSVDWDANEIRAEIVNSRGKAVQKYDIPL